MYVGDVVPKLREMFDGDPECAGMQFPPAVSGGPMFPDVGRANSRINILIGAKMFMEGWSSWRVSGMGLLRVGSGEGPLIIQLFGRGVRLKGAGMSLKRGGSGVPSPDLRLLETLNIFGVRADFVEEFRKYLAHEGVDDALISLPVGRIPKEVPDGKLLAPEYPESGFSESYPVSLAVDPNIRAVLDLSSPARRIASADGDAAKLAAPDSAATGFSENALACLDWDKLHMRLQEHKAREEMWNLIFPRENLPKIMRECCAAAVDADSPLEPNSWADVLRIRDAARDVLLKYADKFYAARRGEWERENIYYAPLTEEHPNFPPGIPATPCAFPGTRRTSSSTFATWRRTKSGWRRCGESEDGKPPRVFFANHLYQPLLLADALGDKTQSVQMSPPGLNKGEEEFVRALRAHLDDNPPKDGEIFLLRNQSRAGFGFHDKLGGVYPDFILWIKRGKSQRIVFIEPHGMVFALSYQNDPRAKLHEKLREDSERLAGRPEWENIRMDSFIVSRTEFADLWKRYDTGDWTKEKFRKKHILFPEDPDYIAAILQE